MIRIALLLVLLLTACAPAVTSADAAPEAGDATSFETGTDASMPPLTDLDAGHDVG